MKIVRLKSSIDYFPFISKHISSAQDDRTFKHQQKHDSRHLHGCALARFLNISVICLYCYVLDMFVHALNFKLEPHCICITLEKPNSSFSAQDPRTASYKSNYLMHQSFITRPTTGQGKSCSFDLYVKMDYMANTAETILWSNPCQKPGSNTSCYM